MTKACSPTSMHAALSSVNSGLKLNPSFAKNALLRSRSATGMFTNSMRPGCAGLVILDLHSVRFSHQDSPLADEQERHRCRSAPDAAERRITPGGSLPRGAALEVRDASLQTWPAASTAPFNWVRNPSEKPSVARWRTSG